MNDAAFLLSEFCRRHDVDGSWVVRDPFGQLPYTIDYIGQDPFTGHVARLAVRPYAGFGNRLYQLTNAYLIARRLGVTEVEIPLTTGGPETFPIKIDGITILSEQPKGALRPVLAGCFYAPFGFERCVGPIDAARVLDAVRRFVRPLYASVMDRSGALGSNVLAVHFRGGDIFFPGGSHSDYVQPPASYYLRAIDFAISRLEVDFVHLVFQDRTNPAVDIVQQSLAERGIRFAAQTASLIEDVVTLVSAQHIVAGYGTFCEAAAVLAPRLESYIAFRSVVSQMQIPGWPQTQIEAVLQAKGARTVVIDDPAGDFIAPGTWANTAEQCQRIRDFPSTGLRLMIRAAVGQTA